jgi:hypothetical protein
MKIKTKRMLMTVILCPRFDVQKINIISLDSEIEKEADL